MSDEVAKPEVAIKEGRDAYKMVIATAGVVLSSGMILVLNTVWRTADAVNEIKIEMGSNKTTVAHHGRRLDRLEDWRNALPFRGSP